MKNTVLLILTITLAYLIGEHNAKTDLEIYTKDNIIYISGLIVTNEAEAGEKRFKTKEELREYISTLTANQWN